ncbi:MAG: S-layer homology domain-containing protein [Oscillospiraceae bacterium]
MRKKLIAAVTLTALLAAAVGAALAAPGTNSDPFITLSYLTDTYYAEAEQAMLERAETDTADTEKAAFDRLDALAKGYLAQAGGEESAAGSYAAEFARLTLSLGDRLELITGTGLLYEAGQVYLSCAQGVLVDVTDGSTVSTGGTLKAGHRYVAAENTACSLIVHSDAAYLSVQGYYDLERSGETCTPFTDLVFSAWYYDDVRFVYENKLFQGMTATTFSPGDKMNRAMLATVLYRMAGAGSGVPSAGFTDVADDAWYADPVNWAANMGIVTGMGNGTFAPTSNVTREQMAAMLYRFARDFLGMEVPATGDLSGYSDRAKVSSWAEDAMSWAVGHGIMNGYENGTLSPGGTASRAEVAAMLRRFSNLI